VTDRRKLRAVERQGQAAIVPQPWPREVTTCRRQWRAGRFVSACMTIWTGSGANSQRRTAVGREGQRKRASSRFATVEKQKGHKPSAHRGKAGSASCAPWTLLSSWRKRPGGYHVDDLLGKHANDVVHPVDGYPESFCSMEQHSREAGRTSVCRSSGPSAQSFGSHERDRLTQEVLFGIIMGSC